MKYNIKVKCQKEKLHEIREFVAKVLSKYELNDIEINTLVLAVDEVCANLIIHGHHCNPSETITLKVNIIRKKSIIFDIIDNGAGFDISQYNEPHLKDIIKTKRKGGVGLMLVKRIMDDIDFIKQNNLSIVRLTKHL